MFYLKEQNLVRHNGAWGLCSCLNPKCSHFLSFLYLASNFPSLKLSLISCSSFLFSSAKLSAILKAVFFFTAVFSCHFIIKIFFQRPLPEKQLRDLFHTNLPFVWETRRKMRSWGGEGTLSVCLPACLPGVFYWVSSRCWKDQLGTLLFAGFAQTLGLMVMFQHIMLIAGITWPSMSIWSGSCSENLSSSK